MPLRLKVYIGFIVICLLWGSSWAAVKLGIDSIPTLLSLGLRFAIASLILGTIAISKKIGFPKEKYFWKITLYITLTSFSLPFILIYWAQMRVDSGLASVLFATFPLWVTVISFFSLKEERISLLRSAGVILSFIGVVFIFSDNIDIKHVGNEQWIAMTLIIVAAVMQASSLIAIRKYAGNIHPISLNLWSMSLSAFILLAASIALENYSNIIMDTVSVGSLVYLSIFCTVLTFVIYFWLAKHMEAPILSLSAFLTPIIAVIVGVWFMGEELTCIMYVGIVLVLIGVGCAMIKDVVSVYRRRAVDA
jgi:putative membrane protein PagO